MSVFDKSNTSPNEASSLMQRLADSELACNTMRIERDAAESKYRALIDWLRAMQCTVRNSTKGLEVRLPEPANMPSGVYWPHYDDNTPVCFGDIIKCQRGTVNAKVVGITIRPDDYVLELKPCNYNRDASASIIRECYDDHDSPKLIRRHKI